MKLTKTEEQILKELDEKGCVVVSVHQITLRKSGGVYGTRRVAAARKLEKAGLIKQVRHHSGRMPANRENTATMYYDEYIFEKVKKEEGNAVD
jgi:hypothetical protein